MVTFESDYNNGAHPTVLRSLIDSNDKKSSSYGSDCWSQEAREKIRLACQCNKAEIFFLVGGTQTNATVIDAMLPSYGAVIAVETAHINVHESGAVEANGHKVITLPSHNGKMSAEDLKRYLERFFADPIWEHMAVPGMIYLTFPTELGSVYCSHEIAAIYELARQYSMPLFIDGARLGYGLTSEGCDFDLPWLARHCDVFYIGGTKVGALCGEAVVFTDKTPKGFFTTIKRHGALLAKSRLAGVQFNALFTDNLYLTISRHAINMAMKMREIFIQAGFEIKDSPTNQQFVVLNNEQMRKLATMILFETWKPINEEYTLCRFVTSWATTDDDLKELSNALQSL